MRNSIASLLFCLCLISCTQSPQSTYSVRDTLNEKNNERAVRLVQEFYTAYTSTFLNGASRQTVDSLKDRYLTQRLIAKVIRMAAETDANPIIRAQDFSEQLAKTLSYKILCDDWCQVQYIGFDKDTVKIPVKVVTIGDKQQIDYITPPWNGDAYGEILLSAEEMPASKDSNDATALGTLKHFYAAYTTEYYTMPEDLNERLEALKAEFCTKRLRATIKDLKEAASDEPYYDPLILACDFDKEWAETLTIQPKGNNRYSVRYKGNGGTKNFQVVLEKVGKKYLLDEIVTK